MNHHITPPNMRARRAEALAAHVMNAIEGLLDRDRVVENIYRKAHITLIEMFSARGVDLITDMDREAAGLPPRGPHGWTSQELVALEAHRLRVLMQNLNPMFVVDTILTGPLIDRMAQMLQPCPHGVPNPRFCHVCTPYERPHPVELNNTIARAEL